MEFNFIDPNASIYIRFSAPAFSSAQPAHLNDLVTEPESAVPGGEAAGRDIVDEDLGVPLLVLVLIAEGEPQHLCWAGGGSPELNLLKQPSRSLSLQDLHNALSRTFSA